MTDESVLKQPQMPIVYAPGAEWPKPSVTLAMPEDQYHANREAVNQGSIALAVRSPLHFYNSWIQPHDPAAGDTPILRLGRFTHACLLEGDKYAAYVVQPTWQHDGRTKEGKAERAAFKESLPENAVLISEDEKHRAESMALSLRGDADFAALMKDALTEVVVTWVDPSSGVLCRARFDILSPLGIIGDVKTTEDASEYEAQRSIGTNEYYLQAAHYLAGAEAMWPGKYSRFWFGFVERNEPFASKMYELDDAALARGKAMRAAGLERIRQGVTTNQWPGYGAGVKMLGLPQYIYQRQIDGVIDF